MTIRNDTMLYKAPGPELLHGVMVQYTIVDAPEVPDMLNKGWFLTPTEAHDAVEAIKAEVDAEDVPERKKPGPKPKLKD